MRIDEILRTADEPVFSFEFFPPKTKAGDRALGEALEELRRLAPDFVSVTYGAGGSTRSRTLELTRWIKHELELETMAHLTCVGASRDELRATVAEIEAAGVENVLALRGDPPRGQDEWEPHPDGLADASELTALIAQQTGACTGGACFPEIHPESVDLSSDLRYLREKVEAGATFLITNLFLDNRAYFRFVEEAHRAGVDVPILPGIMPITKAGQLETMTALSGTSVPHELREAVEACGADQDALVALGVAYATLQCAELLAAGAPGVHFYTLNRAHPTRAILSSLRAARPWETGAVARPAAALAA